MPIIVIAAILLLAQTAAGQPASAQAHRDALTHFRTGMEALESERYDEAEHEFKSAIRLEPEFEGALYGLGQTFMRKHQSMMRFAPTSIAVRRSNRMRRTKRWEMPSPISVFGIRSRC